MRHPDEHPLVRLPGDSRWVRGYEWSVLLDAGWPDGCGFDFAHAISENVLESDPIWRALPTGVTSLECEEEGERGGGRWVWLASFGDGTTWRVTGWCSYTGWDCQSGMVADQVDG